MLKKVTILASLLLFAVGLMMFSVGCDQTDKTVNSDTVLNDDATNHDPPGGAANVVPDTLEGKRDGIQLTALAGPRDPLKWPTNMWDFSWPTAYGQAWKITCGYGCYKHTSWSYSGAAYYSVDLVRTYGTTEGSCVTAPARGVVIFSGGKTGYGYCVIMDHDYGHTGQGYRSIVAH